MKHGLPVDDYSAAQPIRAERRHLRAAMSESPARAPQAGRGEDFELPEVGVVHCRNVGHPFAPVAAYEASRRSSPRTLNRCRPPPDLRAVFGTDTGGAVRGEAT